MEEHELETCVMNALANKPDDWTDFQELDRQLKAVRPDLKDELRRSLLRGAVGRMIRDGRAIRDKKFARYRIGDQTLKLFE